MAIMSNIAYVFECAVAKCVENRKRNGVASSRPFYRCRQCMKKVSSKGMCPVEHLLRGTATPFFGGLFCSKENGNDKCN